MDDIYNIVEEAIEILDEGYSKMIEGKVTKDDELFFEGCKSLLVAQYKLISAVEDDMETY